jgi:hypothetical protein
MDWTSFSKVNIDPILLAGDLVMRGTNTYKSFESAQPPARYDRCKLGLGPVPYRHLVSSGQQPPDHRGAHPVETAEADVPLV